MTEGSDGGLTDRERERLAKAAGALYVATALLVLCCGGLVAAVVYALAGRRAGR